MRSVYCVVLADVEVVRVRVKRCGIEFGNITESFIRRRCDNVYLTVFFRFLRRFFSPLTGHAYIYFLFLHQVERDHGKLRRTAALQKKHFVVVGNIKKFAKRRFRTVDYLFKSL